MTINLQVLQGHWDTLRGQVKGRWGQLSDDDLRIDEGGIDRLIGRIQQKTGEGREAVEQFLDELVACGAFVVSRPAEQVAGYASRAADRARDDLGRLADEASGRFDRAQDVVRHSPAQSVVAAFGIGLVAGLIVGLALRSR